MAAAARALLFLSLAGLAVCLLSVHPKPVHASGGSLPIGSVSGATPLTACDSTHGVWLHYMSGGTNYQMTCVSATLTGCASVQDLGFTYGYLAPSGPPQGVIVYFDGTGGTRASEEAVEIQMLQYYSQQNYEVVQIAWSTDWEQTQYPFQQGVYGNIQNAACRPATFLNYVYTNIYTPMTQGTSGNPRAGMCAQGFSAGSAAIVYSLAYYGAVLDAVELISGPVLSDVEQGCHVPYDQQVTVCPYDKNGVPQYGCRLGSDTPWSLLPTYVEYDADYVSGWTNDVNNTCAGTSKTSPDWNARWLAQSIVDQNAGATPTFNYPNTAMSGWLCNVVSNPNKINCGSNYQYDYCPNNSSPQGQIFYANITSANSPRAYNVYSVDACHGPEGAPQGTVSYLGNEPAQTAIEEDLAGGNGVTAQCAHPQ